MARPLTQIIENNSIPPPCPTHWMSGSRMTSCMAVPTKTFMDHNSWWNDLAYQMWPIVVKAFDYIW